MPSRQSIDLQESLIDPLRVEAASALEERLLVAEIADVRAAARHDDGVRHEVKVALDQIAPDRREAVQRAHARPVESCLASSGEIGQELRPRVLAGSDENRIGMRRCFVRKGRHVQPAKHHVHAACAVVIGEAIGALRRSDVDLDHDQIGIVARSIGSTCSS